MSDMADVLAKHQDLAWNHEKGRAVCGGCDETLGPMTAYIEKQYTWLVTHQAAALSAAGFGLVADAVVIHVAHDTEAHARSFNEGYETAMAQELADDPTTAQDWLEGKLVEAKANALLTAADALDELWGERKDRPDNGWRDWADGVEEAETLVRDLAAKEILP